MKRWSQGELDECRRQIATLLDNGWIRPSRASHAASIVFARKADGSWRFCQDYRQLNALTKKSVEPLPHIDQLIDETRGARFFTKLDLASAYHQFRIRESDVYKTSIRVPGGQYEFRVGAFGLHGMASLLMRYTHAIFSRPALAFDQAGRPTGPANGHGPSMLGSFVACYMDDILVFSRTAEEHQAHVRMVLETLQHHRLFAKASKCEFCRSSVAFLGHVISAAGVAVDTPQDFRGGGLGPAGVVHRRPQVHWLGQLLPTFLQALCGHGSASDCLVQPARHLPLGATGAGCLRDDQAGAYHGSSPPRLGRGSGHTPGHGCVRAGGLCYPGAAG